MAVTINTVKSNERAAQEAFEVVFDRHWSQVYRLLFHLVGEQAEAEDLAVEVFWRYHQHSPEIQDPQKLGGWLYRVALRLGYNALRSHRRRRHYEELAGQHKLSLDFGPNAEGLIVQTEQRKLVRRVLAQMKSRAAQILVLRHTGSSYAEIAATLDISPGSVGTLLSRAEQEFQQRFKKAERGE